MKRVLLIMFASLCLVTMFGCNLGSKGIPANYSGTDLAKLLLANERLDATLLHKEGDIFDDGAEILRNLAASTSASYQASTTSAAGGQGKVTIEGTTFTFSNFEENCNAYDYFENLTEGVVSTCNTGADMIDFVKKHIRVVDKWVSSGDDKVYLHVAENEEVLYEYRGDQLNICRRWLNNEGQDVYDVYIRNDTAETRMTYIPGLLYEFSDFVDDGVNQHNTYFAANYSKGYWEVSVVGGVTDSFYVTCMALKEDICYSAHYDPQESFVTALQVISADRKADLIFFNAGEEFDDVSLHFGGFDGIQNVLITVPDDEVGTVNEGEISVVHVAGEHGYTAITGLKSGTVNLTNGKQLKENDTYVSGNVVVGRTLADYAYGLCKGTVDLRVYGESREERMQNIKLFLAEAGLTCRRNPDKMLSDVSQAYTELDAFVSYYRWNGHTIANVDGVRAGIQVECARFDAMANLYEAVKHDPVVDINDVNFQLNINFAPITEISVQADPVDGDVVRIQNIALTVSDMTLFVEDEPYMVNFALIEGTGGGLIHLEVENSHRTTYAKTKTFTVAAEQVPVKLPALKNSAYKLVAYISTVDGIRTSGYKEVMDLHGTSESQTALTTQAKVDYATFYTMVCEVAYQYGLPAQSPLEYLEGETYIPMAGDETEIATGVYRLAYTVANEDRDATHYVYVAYTAP